MQNLEIYKLKNEIKALQLQLENQRRQYEEEINYLKSQLATFQRRLFGQKSERTSIVLPDGDNPQLSLFDEAEHEATLPAEEPAPATEVKSHKRKKNARKDKLDYSQVPHEKVYVDEPAEGISCSACGGSNMEYIGEKLVRQEIHVTEPKIVVYDIYQKTYKCLDCSDDEHTSITAVPAPNALVPHSPVSASSMTAVILNKYLFALPLNRQEKFWSMLHLDIGKSTMANWIQYSYRLYLRHIDRQMHRYLLQENILHADETPVQVMKEPQRKNTSKSYMWLYTTGEFAQKQVRLFRYAPGRGQEYPVGFLKGFQGYLHTDGYAAYGGVADATICMCWAHARRKFVDAIPQGVENISSTIASKAIRQIDALFKLEKDWKGLSAGERQEQRQAEARPLIDALLACLEKSVDKVPNKSKIAIAIRYVLTHRTQLTNYLLDGNCSISNNLAERSIRPFTVGRKNWLFSGSPTGAAASAAIYSIIETCLANDIDPRDYFMYIFKHMPQEARLDDETVQKYLPWNTPMYLKDK